MAADLDTGADLHEIGEGECLSGISGAAELQNPDTLHVSDETELYFGEAVSSLT